MRRHHALTIPVDVPGTLDGLPGISIPLIWLRSDPAKGAALACGSHGYSPRPVSGRLNIGSDQYRQNPMDDAVEARDQRFAVTFGDRFPAAETY